MKIVIIGKNFTISTDIILNNSIHISYPPIYIVWMNVPRKYDEW